MIKQLNQHSSLTSTQLYTDGEYGLIHYTEHKTGGNLPLEQKHELLYSDLSFQYIKKNLFVNIFTFSFTNQLFHYFLYFFKLSSYRIGYT